MNKSELISAIKGGNLEKMKELYVVLSSSEYDKKTDNEAHVLAESWLKGERTDDFFSFDDVIADAAETFLGNGNDLRLFCTEEEAETVKVYFEHENALFFFYEPYQSYSLYNMAETIFKRYSDYVLT